MRELPYYKQQTPFTCSLACLRMVLESVGRKFTEDELAKIIGFKPNLGFSPLMIMKICEIIDVKCKLEFDVTADQIKSLLSNGIYPIALINPGMLYNLPEVEHNHYVVIKDISEEKIIINDPDREYGGEGKEVELSIFFKAWKNVYSMLIVVGGKNDNKRRSV